MDQRANSYALFQSAILLEEQVRARTMELRRALAELETSNIDLSKAKEQAELSNSSKTRFLAAASHDLLQPLSAARLNMSTLKGEDVSPQAGLLISQIDRSLMTIEELLRTLFDISKLDARVSVPEICRFPAERIIRGLHADFNAVATKAGLKLKVFSLPVIVDTDPIYLRRILQNLVSNALRYTKSGGVLIGCRIRGTKLVFEVWDTGFGIPEHEHERIFEEFHRLPNEGSQDGLGLGLAIVKRMGEATGHEISFSSVYGRGSVFRVSVPISYSQVEIKETPAPQVQAVPKSRKMEDAFIIVVEDDSHVLEAMERLLGRWGATCLTAASLSDLREKLEEVERVPDVIIADYNLADETVGPAVVRFIRDCFEEDAANKIPAVIVSAKPSDEVMEQVRSADCEFMSKPVEPAELRALLNHMLNS
jgi:signal transduction histidine kinase/CheY-like chemotaxis protein